MSATADRAPLRVAAGLLQQVCRDLLPGYAATRREPERLAVLTRACLERVAPQTIERGGSSATEAFDELARAVLLHGEPTDVTLYVFDAEQASDLLCALWLARRTGLFQPGSSTAEASGKRSRVELVPTFSGRVSAGDSSAAMAGLYANAAFRRHLEARGRAHMLALAGAA